MSHAAKVRVNREDELVLLERVAAGQTAERVLLVRAEGGVGKSELLREFETRCPKDVLFVLVDFKGGGVSLAELFSQVCDALGWEQFPTFTSSAAHFAAIHITRNTMLGSNTINVALTLNTSDEETRQARRTALTDAFCADLRALGRAMLAFDTFEQGDPLVKGWLASAFLARFRHIPNLTIIVAGRETPEPTSTWHALCHELPLENLSPEHQCRLAETNGITVTLEYVRGCCDVLKGNTLLVASFLSGQRERRA